ncbi:protein kinase domain containing protein [Sesbania bispinosa]|nr:protein kinase domain containing protein [Sesbania bispinosa]
MHDTWLHIMKHANSGCILCLSKSGCALCLAIPDCALGIAKAVCALCLAKAVCALCCSSFPAVRRDETFTGLGGSESHGCAEIPWGTEEVHSESHSCTENSEIPWGR